MILSEDGLRDRDAWQAKGYHLPAYDRAAMIRATREEPFWIHFGAGNIFRAFQANVAQNLLERGVIDRGLIVAEGFDAEIIEKMYRPHDNYSVLVTLRADGSVEKTVVGSIAESCILDAEDEAAFHRLTEIFCADSLQMATFTITEKGYSLTNAAGEILPDIAADFEGGPQRPKSYLGKVTALLAARYLAGQKPIAMVSMDNCSHNGDKLRAAVEAFARHWTERGLIARGFWDYVRDAAKVSFPWTMIDKITPRPDAQVEWILSADGLEGLQPVVTSKNTYVAPFVNAEECEYLVIEDAFPNGRPALEAGGLMFTDRETVDRVERMKVCTCLNPLHTALAVFGCLLGYEKISDEMEDAALRRLVERIGYVEGLPVVIDPGVLNPREFIDTVLNVRLPNPFMPDTPQRIATDTSQKLAVRFGETIKNYRAAGRDLKQLKLIPLVFAGWLRYLTGIDDEGRTFELSPDPLLDELCPYVAAFQERCAASPEDESNIGKRQSAASPETEADIAAGVSGISLDAVETALRPVLSNEKIFGVNLCDVGMAETVCGYFSELTAGVGAVRRTLEKYTA